MIERSLDLDAVEAFVRIAELGSFTRAAEAMSTAQAAFARARQRLTIGISDHVAGPELPALIARMNQQDPQLLIEIRIGSSGDLLQSYDRRELDAVLARMHVGRSDGELIAEEPFGW